MKTINVTFEEDEWTKLLKAKGKASWHDFIMQESRYWWKNESNRD